MSHIKYGVRINHTKRLGSREDSCLGFYSIVTATGEHDAIEQTVEAMDRVGWAVSDLGTVKATDLYSFNMSNRKSVETFLYQCERDGLIRIERLPKQTILKRRERA